MVKRKELNIGCSDFKSIIENDNYFIDKSLFIINKQKGILFIRMPFCFIVKFL